MIQFSWRLRYQDVWSVGMPLILIVKARRNHQLQRCTLMPDDFTLSSKISISAVRPIKLHSGEVERPISLELHRAGQDRIRDCDKLRSVLGERVSERASGGVLLAQKWWGISSMDFDLVTKIVLSE